MSALAKNIERKYMIKGKSELSREARLDLEDMPRNDRREAIEQRRFYMWLSRAAMIAGTALVFIAQVMIVFVYEDGSMYSDAIGVPGFMFLLLGISIGIVKTQGLQRVDHAQAKELAQECVQIPSLGIFIDKYLAEGGVICRIQFKHIESWAMAHQEAYTKAGGKAEAESDIEEYARKIRGLNESDYK